MRMKPCGDPCWQQSTALVIFLMEDMKKCLPVKLNLNSCQKNGHGVIFTMHAMIGKRLNEINRGSTAGIVLSALLVLAVLLALPAAAQLRIEISKGATGDIPVGVGQFASRGWVQGCGDAC